MKIVNKLFLVPFAYIILLLFLFPEFAISDTVLNVPILSQEHSNWCWAASDDAILLYMGRSVSQCDIALFVFDRYCCGNSEFNWNSDCNSGVTTQTSKNGIHSQGLITNKNQL